MKFIRPSYSILTKLDGQQILKNLESAVRTAYKSENLIRDGSAEILMKKIVHDYKHLSTIEHESVSVRIICCRGISHELVRHRLASYTQESTRYCNYTKNKFGNQLTFIIPSWFSESTKQFLEEGNATSVDQLIHASPKLPDLSNLIYWWTTLHAAEINYNNLIENGWSPQQARSVLPTGLKTEIVVTANLREWRHIFKTRADRPAHPQMREIMCPMLKDFRESIPIIFDDLQELENNLK
jgi:thymidylate synthase (FAD)